jgi:diphosphomevalonate decarboxylase
MLSAARAPSNIALIKYMGKQDAGENLPANGSLSLTLDSLCTVVEVHVRPAAKFAARWIPELPTAVTTKLPLGVPSLADSGVARVIRHAERVRAAVAELFPSRGLGVNADAALEIRTGNTFPAASGIASSASSFAALTLAVARALAAEPTGFERAWREEQAFRHALARLSRRGSGSSCRSFEGPWVLWEGEQAAAIRTGMPEMTDLVVVVGAEAKSVSSSEAHSRVATSPLWDGRVERAGQRLRDLEAALGEGDLRQVSRIAWSETWEMHSLFHTCSEPFTYWEPGTVAVLRWLMPHLKDSLAPIVTMDAGANVHVLVPTSVASNWAERLEEAFPEYPILRDAQGVGAVLI